MSDQRPIWAAVLVAAVYVVGNLTVAAVETASAIFVQNRTTDHSLIKILMDEDDPYELIRKINFIVEADLTATDKVQEGLFNIERRRLIWDGESPYDLSTIVDSLEPCSLPVQPKSEMDITELYNHTIVLQREYFSCAASHDALIEFLTEYNRINRETRLEFLALAPPSF